MKGFSIIICCYNSAKILPVTLSHLAKLSQPQGWEVEVIIVDNCCTDNSIVIAEEIWMSYNNPFELFIEKENTPGLSAVRVKGIGAARYDYLIFCDDDNFLYQDYLLIVSKTLSKNLKIGAIGGYGVPIRENVPDYWPPDFNIYGCGPQAEKSGKTVTLHGAGIIIKKEAFLKLQNVGFNFILSDRTGNTLSSGGDYELCYAIALAGYEVWYEEALKFSHFIKEDRFSWEYCKRFIQESAPAIDVLEIYKYCLTTTKEKIGLYYLRRVKSLLFHIKKALLSYKGRYQYRHNEQIRFLETFHLEFHLVRMRLIVKNFINNSENFRKVQLLKKKLRQKENKGWIQTTKTGLKDSFANK